MTIYITPIDAKTKAPTAETVMVETLAEAHKVYDEMKSRGVTNIHTVNGDVVCDFCSTDGVTKLFRIRPGGMTGSFGDEGHFDADGLWAACPECDALIMAHEWEGLAERSIEEFFKTTAKKQGVMDDPMNRLLISLSIKAAQGVFIGQWNGAAGRDLLTDKDFLSEHGIESS